MIEFKGGHIEIAELSRRFNLPWTTIKNRYESGYRDDDLVVPRICDTQFNGKPTTLSQIARDSGLPLCLIKSRYSSGLRDGELVARHHRGSGSENAATKLTQEKVKEIKILLYCSTLKQKEIASLYGIDQSHVSDIKRGKRWQKVKIDLELDAPQK